jgi:very-short-patch-repair endonuclease
MHAMRDDEGRSRRFARKLRRELTDAEAILWSRLRRSPLHKFRRQIPSESISRISPAWPLALLSKSMAETHGTEEEQRYDAVRATYMAERGWRTIRIPNNDVYKRLNDVLDYIEREADRV